MTGSNNQKQLQPLENIVLRRPRHRDTRDARDDARADRQRLIASTPTSRTPATLTATSGLVGRVRRCSTCLAVLALAALSLPGCVVLDLSVDLAPPRICCGATPAESFGIRIAPNPVTGLGNIIGAITNDDDDDDEEEND